MVGASSSSGVVSGSCVSCVSSVTFSQISIGPGSLSSLARVSSLAVPVSYMNLVVICKQVSEMRGTYSPCTSPYRTEIMAST